MKTQGIVGLVMMIGGFIGAALFGFVISSTVSFMLFLFSLAVAIVGAILFTRK